jgi:hypothetical protein
MYYCKVAKRFVVFWIGAGMSIPFIAGYATGYLQGDTINVLDVLLPVIGLLASYLCLVTAGNWYMQAIGFNKLKSVLCQHCMSSLESELAKRRNALEGARQEIAKFYGRHAADVDGLSENVLGEQRTLLSYEAHFENEYHDLKRLIDIVDHRKKYHTATSDEKAVTKTRTEQQIPNGGRMMS